MSKVLKKLLGLCGLRRKSLLGSGHGILGKCSGHLKDTLSGLRKLFTRLLGVLATARPSSHPTLKLP